MRGQCFDAYNAGSNAEDGFAQLFEGVDDEALIKCPEPQGGAVTREPADVVVRVQGLSRSDACGGDARRHRRSQRFERSPNHSIRFVDQATVEPLGRHRAKP
jgi:hypothetical protein